MDQTVVIAAETRGTDKCSEMARDFLLHLCDSVIKFDYAN